MKTLKHEAYKTSYEDDNKGAMKDSHAKIVLHSLSHDARIRFTKEDFFRGKEDKMMCFPFARLELYEKKVFQQ